MKLWHDDVRPAPEGWVWVKNNDDAKIILASNAVTHISLDHDLGADMYEEAERLPLAERIYLCGASEDNGMKLVDWMVEQDICPPTVVIHSWNHGRAGEMGRRLKERFPGSNVKVIPFSAF